MLARLMASMKSCFVESAQNLSYALEASFFAGIRISILSNFFLEFRFIPQSFEGSPRKESSIKNKILVELVGIFGH